MQHLLDQYTNDCSQSTLINSTVCGNQIHDPEPRTSSFCNQKHTRVSHQKSSLTPINISGAQKEKILSKPVNFSLPRKF